MRPNDIIETKKEGGKLKADEIDFLINGYTNGDIPDYQLSAWAMAVYFQGMDKEETAMLTKTMAESGETIDLSKIKGTKVDKHSTGGVGDTTTLILAPLVAACGAPVAKMSGRGLGHTGGTIDKLEAIPGFKTSLSTEKFINSVNQIGAAVAGQTGNLAPADKKLYALRDVTATVDSIPLIASSIMSKKIASGADGIVLDVKTGDGAFMKTYDGALELAETMVEIGEEVGRDVIAVVSDMNQPLGKAVGNSLEVKEAIDTLKGEGPEDLTNLCITLAAQMLQLSNVVETKEEAINKATTALNNGAALNKLKEMIANQGGNSEVVDDYQLLPQGENKLEIKAQQSGYVQKIKAKDVGLSAMLLGAGRATKEDEIDLAVGIELTKKVGDEVTAGSTLATLIYDSEEDLEEAKDKLNSAYQIGKEAPEENPLIYDVVK
ncbi:pyrimidine-nucleoside phosphorylase [Halanaerobacter jeridensis]|uniref:Pyrimidine-nucleoside phosphorylase n=1 Tax=Halanaerobacter jeridensis TaxID=706427 RepID=A0A939BQT8_9FIRM|nr:pyrimidine-nucleoside phosphorylase [Halanaerobacter jeridensis]MBM7555261.1 pyrimidine-nucleoside phosphorylase [Halanaerobacter jeridensis]